jgi:4-hydroxyphenylpyruvate dioxygenase
MVQQLQKIGYDGWLSHEIFSDEFRAASTRRIAIDGMRSFHWLGEQLAGAAPGAALPAIDGVEFIEFVDDGNRPSAELVRLLRGLGFRRTHRHRSKQVELYRQGEINLVVNREDEGFAHAFYLLHGLAVGAIALRVDDPAAATARARDMLASPFVGPIGKGELKIPAVRGVAGSLLYFIERPGPRGAFFDVDFVPDPEAEAPPALGLERIDHIAQVVAETELPSWVLYYKAILGLEVAARTDLADPHGLIVSRALTNADRTVRLPLNTSGAERSAAGRFLQQTAGAGAQHIAFACADILQAAAALPAELKLQAPENYYEDLAARFDLDPALLERMQALRVLYDRIGAGEFFHLYTRAINGVFFEVIERRGGYDRYGEANAPVRLAAQAAAERSAAEVITELRG